MFKTPVHYYLRAENKSQDPSNFLEKINQYLLTFVGDIEVKKESDTTAIIYYVGTPTVAFLNLEKTEQVTVTVNPDDNVTINLINNLSKNVGFRIYNPQTNSYLLNDVNIYDLTTIKVDPTIQNIIKQYHLTPLFQYRDSLVFFAKDSDESIHLINRHLLEYLVSNPQKKLFKKEFSVKVSENISQFVALFDRGLIPVSFHKYLNGNSKIVNLSGLNIEKLYTDMTIFPVYFNFDEENQSFTQNESSIHPNSINIKKGDSIIKNMSDIKYIAIKIAGDISYKKVKEKLVPKVSVSVFLKS